MQELVERRTLNSKTFDLGNGKRVLDISIGALHYKDAQGRWQDVDEGYSEPDTDGFSARFTKCLYLVRIADDGFRRIYPDRNDPSYWIDIGKPFANMGSPVKDKNKWTWDFPQASISIQIQGSALKFSATLKTEDAPTTLTIPFNTQGITRTGRFLYHDGKVVAELRKPTAVDAEGNERDLGVSFGAGKITLSLDTTGLVYPIEIDPTLDLQVGASSDDCLVWWDGGAWDLALTASGHIVGYDSATSNKLGGGLRFLNVTIPPGSTIDVAYLTITARKAHSSTVVNSKIRGEDTDDAATFSDYTDYDGRARTTAVISWDNIPAFTIDTEYNSPEIKTIIKEIVDRGGWASGNNLVLFWDDHDDLSTHNDATIRHGWSYETSTIKTTKLHIEYGLPVTEKTSSDAGSGAEVLSLAASLIKSESGSGVESLGSRLFAVAETGSGIGASSLLAALIGTEETGLGLEFATKVFSAFDSGSGIDAVIARLLAATETGSALEVALLITVLISGDGGLGSDLSTLLKDILASDDGSGFDALRTLIQTTGSDMRLPARPGQVRIPSKGVNL